MTEKEYNDCVTLHADGVYRFIVKNLRHEEDARDVVQTAFEKLWRARADVDAEKSKSYLFTIAYNGMIDHLRKVKRIYLKEEFSENTKVSYRGIDNAKEVLQEALARLSDIAAPGIRAVSAGRWMSAADRPWSSSRMLRVTNTVAAPTTP